MLGGALIFSRGSKSERHLRKKINPAVTRSAVTGPANSRHLKKSLEARHLPGELRCVNNFHIWFLIARKTTFFCFKQILKGRSRLAFAGHEHAQLPLPLRPFFIFIPEDAPEGRPWACQIYFRSSKAFRRLSTSPPQGLQSHQFLQMHLHPAISLQGLQSHQSRQPNERKPKCSGGGLGP